jgi:hypothetical protein
VFFFFFLLQDPEKQVAEEEDTIPLLEQLDSVDPVEREEVGQI